jgi:hypothetical protein
MRPRILEKILNLLLHLRTVVAPQRFNCRDWDIDLGDRNNVDRIISLRYGPIVACRADGLGNENLQLCQEQVSVCKGGACSRFSHCEIQLQEGGVFFFALFLYFSEIQNASLRLNVGFKVRIGFFLLAALAHASLSSC